MSSDGSESEMEIDFTFYKLAMDNLLPAKSKGI